MIAATPWTIRSARNKRPTRAAVAGSLRELQLIEERANLQPLEQPETAHHRQIGRHHLSQATRQRLQARIAGDGHRQDRQRRGLGRLRSERRLAGERELRGLRGLGPERELSQRPDGPDTARLGVAACEVGVGGVGEVIAAVFFLTPTNYHRAKGFAGRQHFAGGRDDHRAIASSRSHEGGGEPESDLSVTGLLGCLGFEGGDFCRGDRAG